MIKVIIEEIKEAFRELTSRNYIEPQMKTISIIVAFGFIAGGCTAWALKDRHAELTSMKALPLVKSGNAPINGESQNKAVRSSKCSFVSERPLVAFKINQNNTAAKKSSDTLKSIVVMGESTAKEPVIYIRDVKNPNNYHCLNAFDEKRNDYNLLSQKLSLPNGSYEIYMGTQKKGEWTKQKIKIYSI